ncbi:MAG: hypothetical protein ABI026_04040 [Gemmatimonadaceae bacterium]
MPESQPHSLARVERISDERAHAALRRAAELQAEAEEQLETQSRGRLVAEWDGVATTDGFRRADVETAAVEAGIAPEFIHQALVEQDIGGPEAAELAPWIAHVGRGLLRTRQHSVELSRTIDAPAASVLEAMRRVFPAHPYGMALIDSIGEPLAGGVLLFDIANSTSTPFQYTASVVELQQLHVTLRSVTIGARDGCELTLRGDLRAGMRRNVAFGLSFSTVFAGLGVALGVAMSAALILPAIAVSAAFGIVGGGGAAASYGAIYKHYVKKLTGEMETLLRTVDTNARTGGAFQPPEAPKGWSGGL